MDATTRIIKKFTNGLMAGLVAVVIVAGVEFLPVTVQAQNLAQASGQSCRFNLNIPPFDLYPLNQRLRGDDDIDGNPATISIKSALHQPPWRTGQKSNGLRLDIILTITERGGDGSAYQANKSFWIKDKWIIGGTDKQIQDCLINVFGQCVKIFAKSARTEAQLMAQCSHAAKWQVKEDFKVISVSNNRKWTSYKSETNKLVMSAKCLSDANGSDAGNIGCKTITFYPEMMLDVNFGRPPVYRPPVSR